MSGGISIWLLALVTLVAVLGIAIWQRGVIAKAKDKRDHSAFLANRPDMQKSDGADPGTKPHGE